MPTTDRSRTLTGLGWTGSGSLRASDIAGKGRVRGVPEPDEGDVMSSRSIRVRVGEALLRTGTELAIDQRRLDEGMAAATGRNTAYSSAHGAVALARWVDSAVLWLAWRVHPGTFAATVHHGPALTRCLRGRGCPSNGEHAPRGARAGRLPVRGAPSSYLTSTGRPVRADSTMASTTLRAFSPSRPLQIGSASPRMTAAKCVIWLASGSLRSRSTVELSNGSHQERVPGKTMSRMVGTDSEPVVPARW